MAALNPEIIKDTAKLISLYKSNPTFREHFDNAVKRNVNATYNYRPLKLYFEVLASTNSPKYKAAYHQVRKLVKHDSEGIIGKIFMSVTPKDILYLNEFARKAERKENATDYSDDEIKEINEIEEKKENIENPSRKAEEHQKRVEAKTPEKLKEEEEANPKAEQEKEQAPIEEKPENELAQPTIQEEKARVEGVLNQSDEKIMETKTSYKGSGGQPIRNIYPESSEPQISVPEISEMPLEIKQEPEGQPSLPSISISNIPSPSGFRNFATNSRTFFKGGAKIGGVAAKGVGRVAGTVVKAGAGAAARLGASAALGAATGGISLVINLFTSKDEIKKIFEWIFRIVIGIIGVIIFFLFFKEGMKLTSPGGDITSCKFYRANEPASYKSNLLLSYISEASSLTGIPPAVLAAFIRVESPASVGKNDDQIRSYAASCVASEPGYVSETGALGIMQIQPPGTKSLKGDAASCEECIDAGAKLLGKTVQNMTVPDDYCDPRTNIIVGSGFILKKMEYLGYKNSGKWNPAWTNDQGAINALVNTYYGDLKYTDVNGNEQDYGVDVWTSIQNCHLSTPLPTIKPGDYCGKGTNSQSVSNKATVTTSDSQLQSVILQQFNIKMDEKFTPTNLRWAYEKFADISDTNFLNLATKNGPVIVQRDDSGSEQESPNLVRLKGFTDEAFFKTILLHELGHIIYNYRSEDSNQRTPHDNLYFSLNQGVTAYGTSTKGLTCYGAKRPESENYPEMLTYYLNPRVTELTYMNNCPSWGKLPYGDVFTTGRNKEYYSLAYKILCR